MRAGNNQTRHDAKWFTRVFKNALNRIKKDNLSNTKKVI